MNRRELLSAVGLSPLLLAVAAPDAGSVGGGPARVGKPLPFDPSKLKGLSEKLLVSHHDNNYGGAVRNLNKVELELARTDKDTPPFILGGLQQSLLQFGNSLVLHELYFANLNGEPKSAGAIGDRLTSTYGSLARWEELFRATGMSLGGGSGWVSLAYDLTRAALHVVWSGQHTQAHAASLPLLVMDMYEHAYQMDYGAATAKYIDAFFANIHWEEVNRRLERAQKAAAALRG